MPHLAGESVHTLGSMFGARYGNVCVKRKREDEMQNREKIREGLYA